MYKIIFLILFLSWGTGGAPAQDLLRGVVRDAQGEPIFAANVYFQSTPQGGVISDENGGFALAVPPSRTTDTLIVSFIGYQAFRIAGGQLKEQVALEVVLQEQAASLNQIVIQAQDPIASQFALKTLNKLDIYTNPLAAADPLRAITSLAASSNTDESANPVLRGSDASRSRVILNGVPVYRPVRNSQLNNIGNFSLFNTEIVGSMQVYPSNPPLSYGNSSAGLVEIETQNKLPQNQVQLSAGLASLGAFVSQKLGEESFMQVYGNYQFSRAFIGLNRSNLPGLDDFGNQDLGLNMRWSLGKGFYANLYSYAIRERYRFTTEVFSLEDQARARSRRVFQVFNLVKSTRMGQISLNHGNNFSQTDYRFGNIHSDNGIRQFNTSLNYRGFLGKNTSYQLGVYQDYSHYRYDNLNPVYFYAVSPQAPTEVLDSNLSRHQVEIYEFISTDFGQKWSFSSGLRSNIPLRGQSHYLSSQMSLSFRPWEGHSFLLSGGRYHHIAQPNFFELTYRQLDADQVALDYQYQGDKSNWTAAVYYKQESGAPFRPELPSPDNRRLWGLEVSWQGDLLPYLNLYLAHSMIRDQIQQEGSNQTGPQHYAWFAKAALSYNNPRVASISLSYIGRPGNRFTPIVDSRYNETAQAYQPLYASDLNSAQLQDYHLLSLGLSKYMPLKSGALILYGSLNNLLNRKNQRNQVFSPDYQVEGFAYYSQQTLYMGMVWMFNY